MHKYFLSWVNSQLNNFEQIGIEAENINTTKDDILDPSTTVDFVSKKCIGRVTVWESKLMDVEILDFLSGEQILFEHHVLNENPYFDKILGNFMDIMCKC